MISLLRFDILISIIYIVVAVPAMGIMLKVMSRQMCRDKAD